MRAGVDITETHLVEFTRMLRSSPSSTASWPVYPGGTPIWGRPGEAVAIVLCFQRSPSRGPDGWSQHGESLRCRLTSQLRLLRSLVLDMSFGVDAVNRLLDVFARAIRSRSELGSGSKVLDDADDETVVFILLDVM